MLLIFSGALFIGIIVFVFEFASYMVYGRFISEKKLDIFFDRLLESYRREKIANGMFYGESNLPYIARISSPALLSRWYISKKIGRIPRWSKWDKVLTNDYRKLREKKNILTIEDYTEPKEIISPYQIKE